MMVISDTVLLGIRKIADEDVLADWIPQRDLDGFENARRRLLGAYKLTPAELLEKIDDVLTAHGENIATREFAEYVRHLGRADKYIAMMARLVYAAGLNELEGLALLTDAEHAKTARIGANNRRGQSEKAGKPRGKVGDGETSLADIIIELAADRDELGDFTPAPDLWEPLFSKLEGAGGAPELKRNPTEPRKSLYKYFDHGKARHITRGRFETRISQERKNMSR